MKSDLSDEWNREADKTHDATLTETSIARAQMQSRRFGLSRGFSKDPAPLPVGKRKRPPEWQMVKAFAIAILFGTILLCTPWASATGEWHTPVTALFTATSAMCVTGLVVVDTGSDFSLFGQSVILVLIQLGGLGLMTMGTFFLMLAGRRLSLQNEFVLRDSLGGERVRGLKSLVIVTCAFTLLLETAGAAILAWRWHTAYGYPLRKAVYHGAFHAISAFCNAGFALYKDSLVGMRTDTPILLTVSTLIVLGSLGFIVLYNLVSIRFWRRDKLARGRVTLHSRLVLITTAILIMFGWIAFVALEWNDTLGDLDPWSKICCALFQSITPRTAGFNVVPMEQLKPATHFLTTILMFIGGSPASTAGGIKTTTLLVLVLAMSTMIRGREETELYGRTIPSKVVREALSIVMLSIMFVMIVHGILLMTEHLSLLREGVSTSDALLFETVSAFATVGLSLGITAQLSVLGKLCLVLCMFVGRLGPLTLAVVIGRRELAQTVRYPEEDVVVG